MMDSTFDYLKPPGPEEMEGNYIPKPLILFPYLFLPPNPLLSLLPSSSPD